MPGEFIRVESNVDRLSAHAIHESLVHLVGEAAEHGEAVLKILVPKGETGALERHVDHRGPFDGQMVILAEVGVKQIRAGDPRGFPGAQAPGSQSRWDYPEFVDRGTGVFGPVHTPIFPRMASRLVFEVNGKTVFATSVQGQPGHHFMAKTYAEMLAALKGQVEIFKARVAAGQAARELV